MNKVHYIGVTVYAIGKKALRRKLKKDYNPRFIHMNWILEQKLDADDRTLKVPPEVSLKEQIQKKNPHSATCIIWSMNSEQLQEP